MFLLEIYCLSENCCSIKWPSYFAPSSMILAPIVLNFAWDIWQDLCGVCSDKFVYFFCVEQIAYIPWLLPEGFKWKWLVKSRYWIFVRSKRKSGECNSDPKKTAGLTGSGKKSRKSPMRIRQVFRRSTSKGEDCTDCSNSISPVATGSLFGIPLNRLGDPDTIPRPVMVYLILTLIDYTLLLQ